MVQCGLGGGSRPFQTLRFRVQHGMPSHLREGWGDNRHAQSELWPQGLHAKNAA